MAVLDVSHVSITFTQYGRGLRRVLLPAIRDLSLTAQAGEVVAIVGASGSGKSLLAHGILGILPSNATMTGEMRFEGEPLTQRRKESLRGKEIVLVPQGVTYLDPLMKVGPQVRNGQRGSQARDTARAALGRYGLDASVAQMYPFELSGGMARRVLIATATMSRPALVIADEPTPGLHIHAARRVLSHFREMADDGAAVVLISHDLQLALEIADRVSVFYAGMTIEDAPASDFRTPQTLRHFYTKALWHAMPEHGFQAATGSQPLLGNLPSGCSFLSQCPDCVEACRGEIPWRESRGGFVRCVLPKKGDASDGA